MRERIWFSLPFPTVPVPGRRGERGWRRLGSAPVRARRSPSNGGNFSLFQLFTHSLIASLAYQQQPNCSPAQQPAALDTGRKDPQAKYIYIYILKCFLQPAEPRGRGGVGGRPCLSACRWGGKWPAKSKRRSSLHLRCLGLAMKPPLLSFFLFFCFYFLPQQGLKKPKQDSGFALTRLLSAEASVALWF